MPAHSKRLLRVADATPLDDKSGIIYATGGTPVAPLAGMATPPGCAKPHDDKPEKAFATSGGTPATSLEQRWDTDNSPTLWQRPALRNTMFPIM